MECKPGCRCGEPGALGHDWGRQQEGLGCHWSPWVAQAGGILIRMETHVTNSKTEYELENFLGEEQVKSWRLAYLEFLNQRVGGSEERCGDSILQAGSS